MTQPWQGTPRRSPSLRTSALRCVFVLLSALLALPTLAAAQPYAAAGGFARPVLQEATATAASVALAVSEGGAVTTTVWAGGNGVWRLDHTASGTHEPVLVTESNDVRTVSAAYVGDALAVTWVSRDRRTGTYHYMVRWGDETRELFQDSLIVPLQLFERDGEAWAAGLFRREGQGQIRLVPLAGGDDLVIYRTDLSQRGLGLLQQGDGLWLGWLEGKNERGEFGLISEWDAYVGYLGGGAQSLPGVVTLGEANVEDERQNVVLAGAGAAPSGVWVLWPDAEGDLRVSQADLEGGEPVVGSTGAPLGSGRPVGAAWPNLYWVDGSSIVRHEVGGDDEVLNVVWSPVTIESAVFDAAAGLEALAWFGRAQGGAIEIYVTDDRTPMDLGWADRLAAAMGWNPWHMWDELIGQALTALVVGVTFGMLLVPLLMLLAPLFTRFLSGPSGALVTGVILGALPVLAGGYLYARVSGQAAAGTPGLGTVLVAALIGALVGWLFSRRGDREAQGTLTLAGALTAFAGITVWSFLTYKQWAPVIGLS